MFRPLGLTPLEKKVLDITFGASKALAYGELGYMVSSTFKWTIPEPVFLTRFLRMCYKDLITFEDWSELTKDRRERKTMVTDKGIEVIRAWGFLFANEEEQRYYKYLDPFENYAKHPEKLDKFLKGKIKMPPNPNAQRPGSRDLFPAAYRQGGKFGPR
jgi:hypothetical protein